MLQIRKMHSISITKSSGKVSTLQETLSSSAKNTREHVKNEYNTTQVLKIILLHGMILLAKLGHRKFRRVTIIKDTPACKVFGLPECTFKSRRLTRGGVRQQCKIVNSEARTGSHNKTKNRGVVIRPKTEDCNKTKNK
jgi:hypothetical protein